MSDLQIVSLAAHDPALDQLEPMLEEMYEYMKGHGLMIGLAPGGAAKLRKSIEATLGRTGMLAAAVEDGQVQGFIYAVLRIAPDYMEERLIGYVGHSYVRESLRGRKIGSRLFDAVDAWFASKGVTSIELQVLTQNVSGIRFWESRGFEPELLQMRYRPARKG